MSRELSDAEKQYKKDRQDKIDNMLKKGIKVGDRFFHEYSGGNEQLTVSEISGSTVYFYRNSDKSDFKVFDYDEAMRMVADRRLYIP